MKKVIILALFLMMSLCSCNGKNLEEIQAMMVNDAFVYTDGPSTWHKNEQLGTEDIREESSLMEFYEDGTKQPKSSMAHLNLSMIKMITQRLSWY